MTKPKKPIGKPSLGSDVPSGASVIVPVKVSREDKAALQAALRDGETISNVTRKLWSSLVASRKNQST